MKYHHVRAILLAPLLAVVVNAGTFSPVAAATGDPGSGSYAMPTPNTNSGVATNPSISTASQGNDPAHENGNGWIWTLVIIAAVGGLIAVYVQDNKRIMR